MQISSISHHSLLTFELSISAMLSGNPLLQNFTPLSVLDQCRPRSLPATISSSLSANSLPIPLSPSLSSVRLRFLHSLSVGDPGDPVNIILVTVTPMPPRRGQNMAISAKISLGMHRIACTHDTMSFFICVFGYV